MRGIKTTLCALALMLALTQTLCAEESPVFAEDPQSEPVLLVNAENPLPEGFTPGTLIKLSEQKRPFKIEKTSIRLEEETFLAAKEMFQAAKNDGVTGFILTSGYRTEKKQRALYKAIKDGTAAKPGHSEHQTGLAFDVTAKRKKGGFETTKQFRWLSEHCWDYGFILRYPKGKKSVTGIPYEPWHYRYVGAEIAQIIRENDWTLEEYCQSLETPDTTAAVDESDAA